MAIREVQVWANNEKMDIMREMGVKFTPVSGHGLCGRMILIKWDDEDGSAQDWVSNLERIHKPTSEDRKEALAKLASFFE